MRVVFMGTPDFSVPTLECIIEAGHEVVGVVTQPDKAKGRGKKVVYTPVKEKALEHGLTVYQPRRAREPEFIEQMRALNPDVMVVVAFGQILPKELLDIPKYGCVNVHASLLPKYRGAAPIQWAVIRGEKVSGVTTMQMDVGLDTGDMLLKTEVPLAEDETGGSLHDKLSVLGGDLLIETLKGLEDGTIVPEKQDDSQSGEYARMLDKSLGKIDFSMRAEEIERLIRGLNPWPSAYTSYNNKTMKLWKARVVPGGEAVPGQVLAVDKKGFTVQTGDGALQILELQMEGKKRMDAGAFLRGCPLTAGEILG
ncbi:MAG TPA: methionyl-tRNA formyltransferase [Lachnospiraceae bacterium]|nr:methionyl-tRNA formyltransferase [Lachnospiraceae bacterium]